MEFLKAPFLVLNFFYSTFMTFLMMLSLILLSMLMILLSTPSVIRHLICGNNYSWLLNLNLIYVTSYTGAGSGLLISMLETLNDQSNNTGAIDVKIDGHVLEEKSPFTMMALSFSSKLDWDSYNISIVSHKFALYLYKSTTRSCMGYWCRVWIIALSCYSKMLDKLQKRLCRTVEPSLAASLELLAHCRYVTSVSLFYRYYFARCSSELAQLIPLPYFQGRNTSYSDRLHDFSNMIPRCYKDVYVSMSTPSFLVQLGSGIPCL